MTKEQVSQEIRSKISQLDDLAREINEYLYSEIEDGRADQLIEALTDLEDTISSFQEEQGWI